MDQAEDESTTPHADKRDPLASFDDYLNQAIDELKLPDSLSEAIKYSLLAPGKRLRPLLCIHSCRVCGGRDEWALPAAAALELIHTFSLVHDDLPALDNDDLRRGRPTLHRKTSESMAILAGDAMMSAAFRHLMLRAPGATAGVLVSELSEATTEMIAGQVYDTLGNLPADLNPLQGLIEIHSRKTGALIRAACRMGAISAGGAGRTKHEQNREFEAITDFADSIGIAFQVVDDILDVTQSTTQLGKTAGKDTLQGKLTYPAVLGLEETKREVQRLHLESVNALRVFGPAGDSLRELAAFVCTRTR
jgi:geranylgeranyl diphosphate synthase type II